jgi:diguanylate cyclase (GGDEF)-like protein
VNDAEHTLKLDLSDIRLSVTKRPVLVILQGQSLGFTLQLDKERTIIGRGSQADLVLRDDIASRLHAEVVRLAGDSGCVEYYLNDLGSTNGTFLNGTRVVSQQLLQDGDKIKVGNHLIKFALLDEFEAEFQERLHQMTLRDELTGLRSRRSLFADIDRVISQRAGSGALGPVTVVMLDLDFFKRVNDAHGHLVGSQTIKAVGGIIREVVGSADMAARYGGEEYMAYLLGPCEMGVDVAEQIRKRVESHPFSVSTADPSQTTHITISGGVASFPTDGSTALELIQRADQALYRAKLSGRNQTCVYDPNLDKPHRNQQGADAFAIIQGPADAQ